MKNKARVIPFTPAELMELHGLTVEDGLRAGYPVVGHRWENTKLNDTRASLNDTKKERIFNGDKIR